MKAKSFLLVAMAFIGCCNLSLANTWRVCSAPNSAAHFSSLTDALASANVVNGDTIYLESGHMDRVSTITKSLCIIGPGYNMADNGFNMMNSEPAVFTSDVKITANKCHIMGCVFMIGLCIDADSITIERSNIKNHLQLGYNNRGTHYGLIIKSNLIEGSIAISHGDNYSSTFCGVNIQNNIIISNNNVAIIGYYYSNSYGEVYYYLNDVIICNNTIVSPSSSYISKIKNSIIYNNIIINTTSSSNVFYNLPSCLIYNNVISSDSASLASFSCSNMVYNATVENTFLANGTIENYYQHLPSGLAVGAGVNGTTCGAYGCTIEGGRPYAKSGIPNGMPIIFDAVIDQAPSPSNTINVSFKTKVNHE